MNEREELIEELLQEFKLVKYRQKMLDIMEKKLFQMRCLAKQVKQENLTEKEIQVLNARVNNLAQQVRALDGESRRKEDKRILE
ncbi:hypothetical protein OW763_04845 [Clostridium aestuarii]|uniref:Uncharacterized protein n=1 Tax=Clostridium aestuarii TaxID=338193 RepID=A0ABT4CXG2_9CLOT|nr:hypothetical protein [Clostridium aestuarii]MCY6483675.1 hypothetical protein [Clostridium aestuarii]